jgi:hypothetical protein
MGSVVIPAVLLGANDASMRAWTVERSHLEQAVLPVLSCNAPTNEAFSNGIKSKCEATELDGGAELDVCSVNKVLLCTRQ